MKALRLYQCSICKLKRELLLEKDTPDLYNCVMTVGCLGKIKLLSQRKGTRPKRYDVSIFTDFESRGFKAPIASLAVTAEPVSLESGTGVLTAGFVVRNVVGLNAVFEVPTGVAGTTVVETQASSVQLPDFSVILELIELEPLAQDERTYTYAPKNVFFFAEGEDDSDLSRTLRIDPLKDQVKVIVDGIVLTSLDYSIAVDKVTFNPPITGASRVDVTVYREPVLTQDNKLSIKFSKLLRGDEQRKIIAWGNTVGSMTDLGDRVSLMCTNMAKFKPAKTYLVERAYVEDQPTIELDLTRVPLLLGYKPYAFEDKRLDLFVTLSTLTTERCSLQRDTDGALVLKTNSTAFTKAIISNTDFLPFSSFNDDNNSQLISVVSKPASKTVIGPV